LTEQQVCAVEDATQRGRYPERDLLLVRLAWRAGLDDHMLARLPSSAFESSGQTASDRLQLPAARGEVGAGRAIPICPAVREAHAAFVARFPNADFVAFSDRQRRETTGSMSPQTIRLRLLRLPPGRGKPSPSCRQGMAIAQPKARAGDDCGPPTAPCGDDGAAAIAPTEFQANDPRADHRHRLALAPLPPRHRGPSLTVAE
jgi:hypothetical protein